jgi:hypothetical protein
MPVAPMQSLLRDGFFVFEEFLDAPDVAQIIDAVESLDAYGLSSRVRRGIAFARRNLLELEFVRALISRSRVRKLIDVIAPGAIAVRAILFDKSGLANWTVPWHQDRSIAVRERVNVPGFGPWSKKAGVVHVQPPLEILQQMLTFRFHLDPCGSDNGPLRVIGGTHHLILDQRDIEASVAASEATVCATARGGLVVMRPLLLHASSPARRPAHRRVVHVEFGPPTLPAGLHWAMA